MTGPTDRIIKSVTKTLAAQRTLLDEALALDAITLVVKMDKKTGHVREVIMRTEHHHSRSGLC